jgi:hypothetical protein
MLRVVPLIERLRDAASEIHRRRSRIVGAMNLMRPSRLLGLPNERARLSVRRRPLGKGSVNPAGQRRNKRS